MRFHVVGLPHTVTSKRFLPCAYTQKVLKFCRIMTARGHVVYHYGAEGVDAEELQCSPGSLIHETVVWGDEQRRWWPDFNMDDGFPFVFGANQPWWASMAAHTMFRLRDNYEAGDFLCVISGAGTHSLLYDMLQHTVMGNMPCVEFGIGYEGVFAPYKVYESNAHRHYVHGLQKERAKDPDRRRVWEDGSFHDTVIPNYFDPADFDAAREPEDYYLYLGRLVARKGVQTAVAACRKLGRRLIIAGQGGRVEGGRLKSAELDIDLGNDITYLGTITDPGERARLISGARAMFVPTQYLEPFGGVFAEGLMSGTPVLTSDWGAFPEYVQQGDDGFRCNVLRDYTEGMELLESWSLEDRQVIQKSAVARFGLEAIGARYEEYFQRIQLLRTKGWNGV
jgi:glycosyltransferase involved in cell wall biosynthesis